MSFVDEKEAKQFLKKMNDREKNASKATSKTPFGGAAPASGGHKHGLLGGIFGGHRHSSAPTPPDSPRSTLPPAPTHSRTGSINGHSAPRAPSEFATLEAFDPQWRDHFGDDLKAKGLNDEFIRENQDFIIEFLKQEQQEAAKQTPLPPPPPPPVNGSGGGLRAPSPSPSARRSTTCCF